MAHQYSRVGFKSSVKVNEVNLSLSYGGVAYLISCHTCLALFYSLIIHCAFVCCLQFTAQTVIFDNVARDGYLTKDFDNGLGSEVKPRWSSPRLAKDFFHMMVLD